MNALKCSNSNHAEFASPNTLQNCLRRKSWSNDSIKRFGWRGNASPRFLRKLTQPQGPKDERKKVEALPANQPHRKLEFPSGFRTRDQRVFGFVSGLPVGPFPLLDPARSTSPNARSSRVTSVRAAHERPSFRLWLGGAVARQVHSVMRSIPSSAPLTAH